MREAVLLTIVIPAHNAAAFLPRMLGSLPDEHSIEIIIVDDASEDATADLCRSWRTGKSALRYIRSTKSGPGAARQTGLERAQGDFVAFADADDEVDERVMLSLLQAAIDHEADVVIGDYATRSSVRGVNHVVRSKMAGGLRRVPPRRVLTTRAAIWGKVYRREFLVRNQIRFEPLRSADDVLFSWATASARPVTLHLREISYFYWIDPHGQLTRDPMYFIDGVDSLRLLLSLARNGDARSRVLAAHAYVAGMFHIIRKTSTKGRLVLLRKAFSDVVAQAIVHMRLQQHGVSSTPAQRT